MHLEVKWVRVIDRTFIQSKMLNKSKGPAVHSLRAQADKARLQQNHAPVYWRIQERLDIRQAGGCQHTD